MNTEIEVKFVNVNHDDIRAKLKELSAILEQPMRTMRRVCIDLPYKKKDVLDAFIRVRDEGNKVTVTYKQFDELAIDGAKEIEITVNDFETAVALFAAADIGYSSYQESKRETWNLDGTEIVLDVWPWLNPYIEVEGKDTEAVKNVASSLGFEWSDAVFGGVMAAYVIQYPHLTPKDTVGSLAKVRFDDPLPEMLRVK